MSRDKGDPTEVERVRAASDIVKVIGAYEDIGLQEKGREYVGLCPFHDDHTPSMSVVPSKQIFHCFVCGAGGDIFSFIQRYHGVGFREALEHLAENSDILLSRSGISPEEAKRKSQAQEALERAGQFFRERLSESNSAMSYLTGERGITEESIFNFGLGYAPASWNDLLNTLGEDFDIEILREADLVKVSERGRPYDSFRNRIMFPLQDPTGKIIGFGGRTLDEEDSVKYLNTKETKLFTKSKFLYGLNWASQAIRQAGQAIIVEGYTDVVIAHQEGFQNVVGTIGTAFTDAHIALLERFGSGLEMLLCFDGDGPGRKAAARAAEKVLGKGNTKVVLLPEKEDPASLIQGGGDFNKILGEAEPAFDFYIGHESKGRDISIPEHAAALMRKIRKPLSEIPSDVQGLYIDRLAEIAGMRPESVRDAVVGVDVKQLNGDRGRSYWEILLIQGLVTANNTDLVEYVSQRVKARDFHLPETRAVFSHLTAQSPRTEEPLFLGAEMELFRNGALGPVLREIYDASASKGDALNEEILQLAFRRTLIEGRVTLRKLEHAIAMLKVHGLAHTVDNTKGRGLADILGIIEKAEEEIRQ